MESRCSHRISPAVQSDVRLRKVSRSRLHSSPPWSPLRSGPTQRSPNSAWHQSNQWFTSHWDHSMGSGHEKVHISLLSHKFDGLFLIRIYWCTLWQVQLEPLLGKTGKTGPDRLAQDLFTGGSERWDLQGVQL